MKRRTFIQGSARLAASVICLAHPSVARHSIASPALSHRIEDFDLWDAERDRPVPLRLYLPGGAGATQPVPLVVFSHGLGGSRYGYRYLGSHWADQGIASLHPQHVGSDNQVWRGNPLTLVQRIQSAASESEARARVLDVRFALDYVLSSGLASQFDSSKIAVAGHSYGANTAMLIAGARVATAAAEQIDLSDARFRAAILISAPPLVGQGPIKEVLGRVSLPTLHITSLEDTINIPGFRSTFEDRIEIFRAMNRSKKTLAVFNAGGHSIFTDRITRSGPEISERIKAATRELGAVFLRHTLMNELRSENQTSPADPVSSGTLPLASRDPPRWEAYIQQWRIRHQDLIDRLITPGAMR